jgi:alpha-beta hydrolase superfamily lysophospholipase
MTASFFDSLAFNERLFFPRRDASPTPSQATDLDVAVPGASLHLRWHRSLPGAPTVLLFHGNGEVVADYDAAASRYAACGANLAIVDYRGYGKSTGTPTLRDAIADAPRVVAAIVSAGADRLVVMGRSLGSASAAELYPSAGSGAVASFVWESGLVDLAALAHRRGLVLPTTLPPEDRATFDARSKLSRGDRPLLVLHGACDTLIVPEEAKLAFAAAGTKDKTLVMIEGLGHNNVSYSPDYWAALTEHLARFA